MTDIDRNALSSGIARWITKNQFRSSFSLAVVKVIFGDWREEAPRTMPRFILAQTGSSPDIIPSFLFYQQIIALATKILRGQLKEREREWTDEHVHRWEIEIKKKKQELFSLLTLSSAFFLSLSLVRAGEPREVEGVGGATTALHHSSLEGRQNYFVRFLVLRRTDRQTFVDSVVDMINC